MKSQIHIIENAHGNMLNENAHGNVLNENACSNLPLKFNVDLITKCSIADKAVSL